MKKALFPGSFDPFTLGHYDIVNRALPLFDEIVIGLGVNTKKQYLFENEKRLNALKQLYKNEPKISVELYSGLTTNYCKEINAKFILRGLRNTLDFEFERNIASMNRTLNVDVETVFMMCSPEFSYLSSTIVREIYLHKGNISSYIPDNYPIV